eukprot:gene18341-13183_t
MADDSQPMNTEEPSPLHITPPKDDRLKNVPTGEGDEEAGSDIGPNAVSESAIAASSQEAVAPSASSNHTSHTNLAKHDALMQKLQTFLHKMPRKPYALHQPLSRLAVIETKRTRRTLPPTPYAPPPAPAGSTSAGPTSLLPLLPQSISDSSALAIPQPPSGDNDDVKPAPDTPPAPASSSAHITPAALTADPRIGLCHHSCSWSCGVTTGPLPQTGRHPR